MTLRARLTAAFLAVVLGPLLIGAALVGVAVHRVDHQRTLDRLTASERSVALALSDLCRLSRTSAEALAVGAGNVDPASAGTAARSLVDRHLADVAALQNASGAVVARAGALSDQMLTGLPGGGSCVAAGSSAIVSSVDLRHANGSAAGRAWAGFVVGPEMLHRLASATGAQVTLVAAGRPVASTLGGSTPGRLVKETSGKTGRPEQVGNQLAVARTPSGDEPLGFVVSQQQPSRQGIWAVLAVIVLAAMLVCVALAFRLARAVTSPLAEVGRAAERVAGGDLNARVPVRRRDEVGGLAESFNSMTQELRAYVDALRASRDQLRRNLELLGDTLSSTHDLGRILSVILDTAMTASGAQAGAIFLDGDGDLHCKVSRGFTDEGAERLRLARIPSGSGVVGAVAVTGEPVRGRRGGRGPQPADPEPYGDAYVAVPFKSSGRFLGVLVLSDRLGSDEFDDGDLATLRGFASQAAVAVDNVLLHEEAQRLSLTDGLTGLWNYRYFQMNFSKEIERAARFGRPLALLMLDLDRFKDINDTHGHPRGDAVLAELARRLSGEIREVDTLARYGGEEMVLVLPETDEVGAQRAAERICDVVRRRPIGTEGLDAIEVTVSIGAAVFPRHGTSVAALVDRADDALYAAKSAGRNTWRMAAPSDSIPV